MGSQIISIRLNTELLANADSLARTLGKSRSKFIADLINDAVRNKRLLEDPDHIRAQIEKSYPFRRARS